MQNMVTNVYAVANNTTLNCLVLGNSACQFCIIYFERLQWVGCFKYKYNLNSDQETMSLHPLISCFGLTVIIVHSKTLFMMQGRWESQCFLFVRVMSYLSSGAQVDVYKSSFLNPSSTTNNFQWLSCEVVWYEDRSDWPQITQRMSVVEICIQKTVIRNPCIKTY